LRRRAAEGIGHPAWPLSTTRKKPRLLGGEQSPRRTSRMASCRVLASMATIEAGGSCHGAQENGHCAGRLCGRHALTDIASRRLLGAERMRRYRARRPLRLGCIRMEIRDAENVDTRNERYTHDSALCRTQCGARSKVTGCKTYGLLPRTTACGASVRHYPGAPE
jgi:hypothetical protein